MIEVAGNIKVPLKPSIKRTGWILAFWAIMLWLMWLTLLLRVRIEELMLPGEHPDVFERMAQQGAEALTQTSIGIAVLLLGTVLYRFRCRHAWGYGLVEIVVGILIATFIFNILMENISPIMNSFLTAFGALYVVVRGYDNIYRSMTKGNESTRLWNMIFFGQDTDAKL